MHAQAYFCLSEDNLGWWVPSALFEAGSPGLLCCCAVYFRPAGPGTSGILLLLPDVSMHGYLDYRYASLHSAFTCFWGFELRSSRFHGKFFPPTEPSPQPNMGRFLEVQSFQVRLGVRMCSDE